MVEKDLVAELKATWKANSVYKKLGTAFMLIELYYGVTSGSGVTLEHIGKRSDVNLTRERVRQIIDSGVRYIQKKETNGLVVPAFVEVPTPYAKALSILNSLMKEGGVGFIHFDLLVKHPYFKGFHSNEKGLISFLNDIGVRHLLYRGIRYLYLNVHKKAVVILDIQKENRIIRNHNTQQKILGMSKTVTWVPKEAQRILKEVSVDYRYKLNKMYELILIDFKAYVSNGSFKIQKKSPVANKEELVQVGIYIKKSIASQIKEESKKHHISYMSFIRNAFIWFAALSDDERMKVIHIDEDLEVSKLEVSKLLA